MTLTLSGSTGHEAVCVPLQVECVTLVLVKLVQRDRLCQLIKLETDL